MKGTDLAALGRKLRREAEEDLVAGLAAGIDPVLEYLEIVREVTGLRTAPRPTRPVVLSRPDPATCAPSSVGS